MVIKKYFLIIGTYIFMVGILAGILYVLIIEHSLSYVSLKVFEYLFVISSIIFTQGLYAFYLYQQTEKIKEIMKDEEKYPQAKKALEKLIRRNLPRSQNIYLYFTLLFNMGYAIDFFIVANRVKKHKYQEEKWLFMTLMNYFFKEKTDGDRSYKEYVRKMGDQSHLGNVSLSRLVLAIHLYYQADLFMSEKMLVELRKADQNLPLIQQFYLSYYLYRIYKQGNQTGMADFEKNIAKKISMYSQYYDYIEG